MAGKTTPWKFCKWDAGACAAVGADAVVDRKLDAVARGVLQRREYYLLHGAEEFLAHGEMNEEARSRRLRKEGTHLEIARGRNVHQLVLPPQFDYVGRRARFGRSLGFVEGGDIISVLRHIPPAVP